MFARLREELRVPLDIARPGDKAYHDAQYLTAVLAVDEKAMRPWLPSGLKLAQPGRADLFCAYFPHNSYTGAYHEAGLFVHVRAGRGTGIFCPWMILDDDRALILGRELLGYPKKLGEIAWNDDGQRIVAKASHRGSTLIEMDARLGAALHDAPPILGRPHRNIIGTLGPALPRMLRFTPKETPIEVRRVDMKLRFGGTANDPLHDMGLGEVVEARLHRVDLSIPLRLPMAIPQVFDPLYLLRQFNPRVL
jgi:acetoacetate decarboxylase